jgi:predicted helicase
LESGSLPIGFSFDQLFDDLPESLTFFKLAFPTFFEKLFVHYPSVEILDFVLLEGISVKTQQCFAAECLLMVLLCLQVH